MVPISHTSFILAFFFSISFFLCSTFPVFSMSADDVEREVTRLFERSELIPQVRITPVEGDRYIIELTFNIGDRWGRDAFVRDLARASIERVFKSNLPLAQGIVKICFTLTEVIHLAIGVNQAKQINWGDSSGSSDFFNMLRSCVHWGKRPEDRTYLIEHKQIIKPSHIISFPPDS